MVDANLTITPKANNLLVKMLPGSPLDVGKAYRIDLVGDQTQGNMMVFGEVMAVGDSPVIPNDFNDEDILVEVGDLVVFPPTSGFKLPSARGAQPEEYRLVQAAVVAAKIEKA